MNPAGHGGGPQGMAALGTWGSELGKEPGMDMATHVEAGRTLGSFEAPDGERTAGWGEVLGDAAHALARIANRGGQIEPAAAYDLMGDLQYALHRLAEALPGLAAAIRLGGSDPGVYSTEGAAAWRISAGATHVALAGEGVRSAALLIDQAHAKLATVGVKRSALRREGRS